MIKLTKELLPNCKLHIVSNGDVFRKRLEFLKGLFSAGLDKMQVSLYDGESQYEEFVELGKKLDFDSSQWELRRRFFDGTDFGLTISNRSGLIDSNLYRSTNDEKILREDLPLKQPCTYLFYQIVIDWDGSVLMCAHDWKREMILGNAFMKPIWDIWKSNKLNRIRKEFVKSSRNFLPCANCDVHGTIMGKKHFDEFTQIVNS